MKEPLEQDHYRTLGVAFTASSSQLKKAYHAAAKKQHPDKVTPSKVSRSTKAFQQLQAAYETLADASERKAYNTRYPIIRAQWDEYERHQKVWQAKRQKRSRFTQEVIVIHSKNDEFKVHGHILKERSPFFKSHFERASQNDIRLNDEDDVVAAYVHFTYHGEVSTELSEAVLVASEDPMLTSTVKAEHEFLAKLYIFGEKVQDESFCDQVITALAATIDKRDEKNGRTFPNCKIVTAIYEGTAPGSQARQMMVDLYAENSSKHWFPERGYNHFHPEFAYDLVREILVHKTQLAPKGSIAERAAQWHKKR
ncbi:Putative BTB/POZ domain, DnaJ domain, SKP1/BTB/POZ domain superfamily protein [Septoria linicola]|uniref:BTB/POZ domain, DnaJ domain, SKP1/BTB/POZ domain superfamily protein n=1 Tax=Septoria linicola TaxID=215465 RepID=A0A9Q9EMI2_9PEZI|nr:putative BTB/POZ domain, DnaJ domain, SKP1/BTB/POZ domain superfamily protein [Septoria linicola]USW55499.1 Putative BTB/POZ domain, DnaJ domain, SKP1/BTB/POZ domain superfamily protein [Septoria linicola]